MFNGNYSCGVCSKMIDANKDKQSERDNKNTNDVDGLLLEFGCKDWEEWGVLFTKIADEAQAYRRLTPFILHVMDCYVCHKEGTDNCPWVIKGEKEMRIKEGKADIEIGVLPDNIEDAKKALDEMK